MYSKNEQEEQILAHREKLLAIENQHRALRRDKSQLEQMEEMFSEALRKNKLLVDDYILEGRPDSRIREVVIGEIEEIERETFRNFDRSREEIDVQLHNLELEEENIAAENERASENG